MWTRPLVNQGTDAAITSGSYLHSSLLEPDDYIITVTYPINSFPAAVNKVLMHGCYLSYNIFILVLVGRYSLLESSIFMLAANVGLMH